MKTSTFNRLLLTCMVTLGTVINLNAASYTLSFVYSQVGSEDQSYNICNYFDKDKIILDSDFGWNKGKDDVCNRNNGGEIDNFIMCKNQAKACSRKDYTFTQTSLTLTLVAKCKDHGTYTAPTVTINGVEANFGSVTFDTDFAEKTLTTTMAITVGTYDVSVNFAGSDKFYVSTLTIAEGGDTPGPGPGPTPGPTPAGDCPEGTALTLGANDINWGATYTPASSTIEFTYNWAGAGWNMSADWTSYDNLYLKFNEALAGDLVFYINGTDDAYEAGKALAGADSLVVDLTNVTTISSIMFKYSVTGSVAIPCMVLRGGDTPTPPTPPTPVGDCPEGTPLTLGANDINWDATYTPATSTLTFSRDWAGAGWNMSADWTSYNNLYLKFNEALAGDLVFYINGMDDAYEAGKALAGADSLVVDLTNVTTISSIMFKYSVTGSVAIPCMVLRGGDTPTPPTPPTPAGDCPEGTPLQLGDATTLWNTSFDKATNTVTFNDAWAGCGWELADDWTKYDNLYLRFAAATTGSVTLYVNGDSDDAEVGKAEAGVDSLVADLTGITNVSSMMIKSEVAASVTLVCLQLRENGTDPTGLETINSSLPFEGSEGAIFTITGQCITTLSPATRNLTPGIYIFRHNGNTTKFIVR